MMRNQQLINTNTVQMSWQQFFAKRKAVFTRQASMRGFTLMETLVAISILLVAVVGPIALIGDALHKLYYARDEMVAINLAQEGIEMVRSVRDSNNLAGSSWDSGIPLATDLIVDVATPALTVCGGCDRRIYIDSATGLYRQGAGSELTPFSRIVTVTDSGLIPDERKVTSVVTWSTGGQAGTITASENIFNWQI